MIAPADSTEEAIAERMQEVRRRGHANAYHLRVGVDRVSDWREHVKAYPLPSVIAACVAGYWATTKLFPNRSVPSTFSKASEGTSKGEAQVAKTTAAAGIAAFAGSIATNLIRQYARGYIDSYIHNLTHKDSK